MLITLPHIPMTSLLIRTGLLWRVYTKSLRNQGKESKDFWSSSSNSSCRFQRVCCTGLSFKDKCEEGHVSSLHIRLWIWLERGIEIEVF